MGRDEHPNAPSVDQSDRTIPINLRQTGDADIQMVVSNRIRQSPFWHLAVEAGCWLATSYNRTMNPRGYVTDDGPQVGQYEQVTERVTVYEAAGQSQIRVEGPDAEAFVNYVVTRDVADLEPMRGKYVILCNQDGGILNDPVLLRLADDEFWFSIDDSDLLLWLQGVSDGHEFDVEIDEIDVRALQVQGPRSVDVMTELVDETVQELPYYGLETAEINGRDVLISQTGWTGEKGFEVYVYDAMENAEAVWNPVVDTVEKHGGGVSGPNQARRIAAGILAWGRDMDHETSPFQTNLAYQVPEDKEADYVGKEALERQREQIERGDPPFNLKLVGLKLGGEPITEYASDSWLISDPDSGEHVGYVTSPWWNPEFDTNIALGYVPTGKTDVGTEYRVHLPEKYAEAPGEPVAARVAEVPFKRSVHASAREKADRNAGEDGSE